MPDQNEKQNGNRDQRKPKRLLPVRIHCHVDILINRAILTRSHP
jgi:hypothetical protein